MVAIMGSSRCRLNRRASSTVGRTTRIGPGEWCMTNPSQLFPASVPPSWEPFMNTTRRAGDRGPRASMISCR